jgi:gas vesicle protein
VTRSLGETLVARKSDRPIVFVEREASSPIWWLLAGGALGAGLALLFAPESGEHTRLSLARRLRRLRDSAEGVLDEFAEAASEDDDSDAELAESDAEDGELDEDVDETFSEETDEEELGDGERPEGNARAQLEQRLAAVRARRQREFADEDEEPVA